MLNFKVNNSFLERNFWEVMKWAYHGGLGGSYLDLYISAQILFDPHNIKFT